MAQNLPMFTNDAATVTSRNAEYPGDPLDDGDGDGTSADPYLGCNRAGSCAPGIGVNTGNIDPKLTDWSIEDQHEAVRIPQDSQHIGGDAFNPAANYPSSGGSEGLTDETPINAVVDPFGVSAIDFDDTISYITALAQAAPGVGFGALNADPINRTSVTIEIGDVAWGTNDVP